MLLSDSLLAFEKLAGFLLSSIEAEIPVHFIRKKSRWADNSVEVVRGLQK